jgi:predicted ABC-type ATPase
MAKDAKILCPMMGGECIEDGAVRDGELVACRFWIYVHGKHPQTGEDIRNGDCAIAWQPVLLIENSKVNRETGAAVESFRNEMVKANEVGHKVLIAAAGINQQRLIEG